LADARNILAGKLRNYRLCKHCLTRHGSRQKAQAPCFICRGLLDQQEAIVSKIVAAARAYEYDTFLIGAMMPTQIYEREDAMRARLKIRGRESAKSQLTRELGIAFAKATRKKVDYFLPDLVINLIVDKENNVEVLTKSRPLFFQGRYTKKVQGLTQKQERCQSCGGKGCTMCGMSGLSSFDSIEGAIAKHLMGKTGGQTPKFSWIGSEDRSSLVLGKGRPFYAKVFDPRKRMMHKIRIQDKSVAAVLASVDISNAPPLRFIVKTRIMIKCDKNVANEDLIKLRSLAGKEIRFDNRSKIATKKVYSATAKRIDNNIVNLTMVADGGLMIKQFVGGQEFMNPNVSELLGAKCECISFDILDVQVSSRTT
jgi:tRNA pseudouridine synthase 10